MQKVAKLYEFIKRLQKFKLFYITLQKFKLYNQLFNAQVLEQKVQHIHKRLRNFETFNDILY
jgi:GGDEF domain-containing protein